MTEKKKRSKRPAVHEVVIQLLKEDPEEYIYHFLELYKSGTVVPAKDIPKLIKAFEEARTEVGEFVEEGQELDENLIEVTTVLKWQLEEEKEEEKKKEKLEE